MAGLELHVRPSLDHTPRLHDEDLVAFGKELAVLSEHYYALFLPKLRFNALFKEPFCLGLVKVSVVFLSVRYVQKDSK
jgi:hypothetical protein